MTFAELKHAIEVIEMRGKVYDDAEVVFTAEDDIEFNYSLDIVYHITDIKNNKDKIVFSCEELF